MGAGEHMVRPISIVRYERLYLAAFVLGSIVTAMSWSDRTAMVAASPVLGRIGWILPTFAIAGIAITLLLWYFTARAPSVAAKWVVVALAVFSVVDIVLLLRPIATGLGTPAIVSIIADLVYVAAAAMLFRPDAKLWFGQIAEPVAPIFEDVPHDR